MADKTVKEIINERGGVKAVADALSEPDRKVPKSTVSAWCIANKLPWWREDAVMALPLRDKPTRKKGADGAQQDAA